MDEIAIVKKQVQKSEWAERIQWCIESGLTVSEWCRENGINLKTYYYHLRKLRKEICEQIPVPVMKVSRGNCLRQDQYRRSDCRNTRRYQREDDDITHQGDTKCLAVS